MHDYLNQIHGWIQLSRMVVLDHMNTFTPTLVMGWASLTSFNICSWVQITISTSSLLPLSSSTLWANICQEFLWHGTINLRWMPPSFLIDKGWYFINHTWKYYVVYLISSIYTWRSVKHGWHSISIFQGLSFDIPRPDFSYIDNYSRSIIIFYLKCVFWWQVGCWIILGKILPWYSWVYTSQWPLYLG